MAEPAFHAAAEVVERLGLSFDAFVFFHQLGEVAALARAHPGLSIVVEHCGGPLSYGPYAGRHDEVHAAWLRGIGDLAACPNVTMKLGGLVMRAPARDLLNGPEPEPSERLAEGFAPWVLPCLESFGPERCMFESNYPVDGIAASYRTLWNAYKLVAADLSPEERRAAFGGTARRVYRLD